MSSAAAGSTSPLKMSLALSKTADVGTQVRFRPASAQGGQSIGGASTSQWSDAWRNGGRATFRPSSTEQGRPTFKNDKEDLVNEIGRLKKAMVESEKDKEALRIKVHRLEVKGREKDKLVSQALSERSSELPERIQTLIKECVSSSSVVEIDNLKAEVRRKQDAIDQLRQSRGENTDGNVPLSERAAAMPHTRSSSKPWDDHEGPLESPVGRTARKVGGGAAKGSSEALSAARGEIERLQKLFNAGEVVREGLERRIGELEGEVHRLRARAAGDPNSPAKGQEASKSLEDEGENGELYTKDGRDFENYIRRLAGLSELPPGDKADRANQRVRVGLGPKPTSKAGVVAEQSKGNREWVVYEVTTQTGKVAGGGTSAECYVTFRGEHGDYGPCQLEKAEGGGGVLSEGAKDVFDVCALDVGVLKAIIVSHDNTGESPSWNLLAVTVRRARTDSQEARTFEFYYDGWISSDKGEQTLRVEIGLSSRQAKGGALMSVAPAASSAEKVPDGIDVEALAAVCRSVTQAILELHVPDRAADRRAWGLATLARRLTSKPVRPPASCRNLVVMLVGPRMACTQFVEWFSGGKMTNAGMGTESCITVVSHGKRVRLESGEQAAGMAAHCEAILSVPRVGKKFCVEEVVGSERRFEQITFIHPPAIEGVAPGTETSSSVSQALSELRGEFESRTNLKATFKELDADGSGALELKEFQGAMIKLGIDMPGPRAERLFKALDVSGEGSIEYEEFLSAFRPARTTYDYDLEEALETAASRADIVLCLLDPKTVHYNARELGVYKRLRSRFESKMTLCAFLRESTRVEPRLKSHVLPETARRLEQAFGIPANTLPPLPTLFIPSDAPSSGLPIVDNAVEFVMLRFAQGLLELEDAAADEAEDNLKHILDACFLCSDQDALAEARPKLSRWLKSFADALSRKKHPPAVKLHRSLVACLKDMDRGHVVEDDVEGWTPQQVGEWLRKKGALAKYGAAFVDEGINGRKLVGLTEESLKRKLGVQSLGHRKEVLRQVNALLEGRKNFLKQ